MRAAAVLERSGRRRGPAVSRPGVAEVAPPHRPSHPNDFLALQRLAGNKAVTGLMDHRYRDGSLARYANEGTTGVGSRPAVQRLLESEKQEDLESAIYKGEPRLEAAFDNSPPMGIGESGTPVRLVQEGLVGDGFVMPESTRPDGTLDGIFGQETDRTVRDFQIKHGLTDTNGFADGRVGRLTMGKLDELAGAGPPDNDLPPCPIPATGPFALVGAPQDGLLGGPMIPGVTCQIKPPTPQLLCGATAPGGQWIPVTPGMALSAYNLKVRPLPAKVDVLPGCPPAGSVAGAVGDVVFKAGTHQVDGNYDACPGIDPKVEVGLIQTVQGAMHMSVYRDPKTGVDSKGPSECVSTPVRDCLGKVSEPWFGGLAGPRPAGGLFPVLSDTPNAPRKTRIGPIGSQLSLQMMFFIGAFDIWLIARLPNRTVVFIHHWTVHTMSGAKLPSGADPCSPSSWKEFGTPLEFRKGVGKGPATPVLTGSCANTASTPC